MLITIRKMIISDTKAVSEIEKDCFSQPWIEKDFANTVTNSNYIYLVALDQNKIVGYAGLVMSSPEGDVTNIAVAKDYRQFGIGNELLTNLINEGKKNGLEDIFLEVRVTNESAICLYRKIGFEEIGLRKNFYQLPTEDAILMKKTI